MSIQSSPKRKNTSLGEDLMAEKDKKAPKRALDFGGEDGKFSVSNGFLRELARNRAESFGVDLAPQRLPIFVAERTDKIVDVFRGMTERNITAVPVLLKDEKSFFGYLELADIVRYIVNHFGGKSEKDADSYWKMIEEETEFKNQTVNDIMKYPLQRKALFLSVVRGYSAFAVVEPMGREPHVHRLAVIDRDTRQLFNLVTQGMVIRFINDNLGHLGGLAKKPLQEIDGVICKVISVKQSQKAIEAFAHMAAKDIGSVAIVNEENDLVGALSLRDIKMVSSDMKFFWRLHQSVSEFLLKMREDWQTRHGRPHEVQYLRPTDCFETAVKMMHQQKLHQVFICESSDNMKPIGIVRIKDIARECVTVND